MNLKTNDHFVHIANLDGGSLAQFAKLDALWNATEYQLRLGPSVEMRDRPIINAHTPRFSIGYFSDGALFETIPIPGSYEGSGIREGAFSAINSILASHVRGLELGSVHGSQLASGPDYLRFYGAYAPRDTAQCAGLIQSTSSVTLERALAYISEQRAEEIRGQW